MKKVSKENIDESISIGKKKATEMVYEMKLAVKLSEIFVLFY